MQPTASEAIPSAAANWATRNQHWQDQGVKRVADNRKRPRPTEPLVLCGHGVTMRVERGALVIRDGLTHYPQERAEHRLFRGQRTLPPRIIMIDGTGSLSFDVLAWLSEQSIPLIRIGWQGDVISTVGGPGSAYDPVRVAWQDATRASLELRLAFSCDLIGRKLRASLVTLRTAVPESSMRATAIDVTEAMIDKLDRQDVKAINDILIAEARAASYYFQAWRGMPLLWRKLKQNPVPDSWLTAETRRSRSLRVQSMNRHATHPINAMLNYAYAVLHSRVQAELVAEGYDPARGVLHESRQDSRAFVLDMIEPRRPLADAAVLRFVANNPLSAADFVIRADGVCRLAPQLARRISTSA